MGKFYELLVKAQCIQITVSVPNDIFSPAFGIIQKQTQFFMR